MAAPTIRLATGDDMRAITRQNVEAILQLPHLHVPTGEPHVVLGWGLADASTLGDCERLHPGALVAPCFVGQTAPRGDPVYSGAEYAGALMSSTVC